LKFINRDTHYAIRALTAMAEDGLEKTTVAELARRTDVPRPFLRKIVQTLNREGILASSRGKGGGFRLAESPDRIVLIRLIQIFQKSPGLHECLFRKKFCPGPVDCPLSRKIKKLENGLLAELAATSIGALAREFSAGRAAEDVVPARRRTAKEDRHGR
jgi:Rrf2 family protein